MPAPVQSDFDKRWTDQDRSFMNLALKLALRSLAGGEVPVGAVAVADGVICGAGWNRPVMSNDPTSHAEIEALREAAANRRNYRLPDLTLYSTLEPCVMCAGALVLARISRLIFAARDIRFGAVRSKFALADSSFLNHRVQIEEGLFGAEAGELLTSFFEGKRRRSASRDQ